MGNGRSPTSVVPRTTREYSKQVLQARQLEKIDRFVEPDFIQHSPQLAAGRDGLEAWLAASESGQHEMLFMLIGQGNFVATLGKRHADDKDHAMIDLYRLGNGLIVEHWDVEEEILSRDQWGNGGKF